MVRTIISIPEEEKEWVDGFGKRHGISSSHVVRQALREFRERKPEGTGKAVQGMKEERSEYGALLAPGITDMGELRRRAAAAAGCFASGLADLSIAHDLHFAEGRAAGKGAGQGLREEAGTGPGGRRKGRGTR